MARPSLQAVGENALSSFQRMTGPQRVTLGLAFATTAIGVFLLARTTSAVPMGTLYANLEPDVAAEVTTELDARGISYDLEAGGRVIMVPAADVHQIRLDLAAQDLPSGSEGWEIIENQSITAPSDIIDVNITRAMQGELARTISSIDSVRSANVHLVVPESDLFADDDQHASASVLVDTGSQTLSPMQVQAIVNLVASSVEGLTADQVSLIDESGRVLAAPGDASSSLDLEGDARFRARNEFERTLEADLENMLANIVGPGLARVKVTAVLDFDAVTTTTEEHRPIESPDGEQLLIDETTRNELYRSELDAIEEGGELEIELPDEIDLDGDGQLDEGFGEYILDERASNYVIDRVVTTSQNAPGAVTALSVAVMLDEAGVDAARLGDIETLIGAAAGLNEERGDNLAIQLLPFNEDVRTEIEAAAEPVVEAGGLDLVALIRTAGTAVVALVIILLAIRNLARNPRRQVVEAIDVEELSAGSAAAELEAGDEDEDEDSAAEEDEVLPEPAELTAGDEDEEGVEPPEERLQHLIANQTEDVAGVLRSWLNETNEVEQGEEVPI